MQKNKNVQLIMKIILDIQMICIYEGKKPWIIKVEDDFTFELQFILPLLNVMY